MRLAHLTTQDAVETPFTLWLKEVGEVELFNITFDPLFPKPLIINN
jgi:hypothetical protein